MTPTTKNKSIPTAVKKKKPPSKFKKEEFYVDPSDLKREITLFYKTDKCTKVLGNYINKIAEGLSYSPSFYRYTYRDEMVGDAIVKMYAALKFKKFNINTETSPFSYFTTIAFHAFINRIKREKKHHETVENYKVKMYEQLMISDESADGIYIYSKRGIEDEENHDGQDSDIQ